MDRSPAYSGAREEIVESLMSNDAALRSYEHVQRHGVDVEINFTDAPVTREGDKINGQFLQGEGRIVIYARNADGIVQILAHESIHVDRLHRNGIRIPTRQEEFLARRRQFLAEHGRRPTVQESQRMMEEMDRFCPELREGMRNPFE